MDLKIVILVLISLLSLTSTVQGDVFDVTKLGGGKDITQGLTAAWKEACAATTASKILIPAGEYALQITSLKGPCKAPVELQVQGTLKAPVEPSKLKGESWVTIEYVDMLTMSGNGVFDGQGKIAWASNNCHKNPKCNQLPMNFRFNFVTNAMIKGITTKDSKNFHVNVLGCKNITFQNFKVDAPGDSINTDGIHIGRSKGVYIVDTNIATGDDCISLGDGSQEVHITNVKCGPGHGISIGSLGKYDKEEPVSGVFVKTCTISGTQNGVRIKSWPALHGGAASNMHFEDIIMENVANPILIDQQYCPWNQCIKGGSSKVKISDVSFKNIRGTSSTQTAVKLLCSSGLPCDKVKLADIDIKYTGPEGPAKSECSNVKPQISGKFTTAGC